jgi:hypothetical protein
MTVYMIVTRDKYRLPRWWGTTTAELAQLSGRKYQNVRFAIWKAIRNGGSYGCYEVVRLEEGE